MNIESFSDEQLILELAKRFPTTRDSDHTSSNELLPRIERAQASAGR
jgi:hypothetical protein